MSSMSIANSSSTGNAANSINSSWSNFNHLELDNAWLSWQPICVAFLLTIVQLAFFLSIFEYNRLRSAVFDKRREKHPHRTPPPLLKGWFQWWSFSLTDDSYRNRCVTAWEERKQVQEITDDPDEFLLQAQNECFQNSPYYTPADIELDTGRRRRRPAASQSQQNEEQAALLDSSRPIRRKKRRVVAKKKLKAKATQENASSELETCTNPLLVMQKPVISEGSCTLPVPVQTQPKLPPRRISSRASSTDSGLSSEISMDISSDDEDVSPRRRSSVRTSSGSSTDGYRLRISRVGSSLGLRRRPTSQTEMPLRPLPFASEEEFYEQQKWDTSRITQSIMIKIWRFLRKHVFMLRDNATAEEVTNRRARDIVNQKLVRRSLCKEQQELLRCVGLDAFVTLRFLRYGFDVSFYPMLVSLFTLIPAYKTANEDINGFFSASIVSCDDKSPRYWFMVGFGIMYFAFLLRRLWIEWEIFLPLRLDFLENGDFEKERYRDQYRRTCLIEYVPRTHKHDRTLALFFEAIFPNQIKRAEVLLNAEYLRWLLQRRQRFIESYEDEFARQVHRQACYLRRLAQYNESSWFRRLLGFGKPIEQKKRKFAVIDDTAYNALLGKAIGWTTGKPVALLHLLDYHKLMIKRLNQEIEAEYLCLAREQRRTTEEGQSPLYSKFLGLRHLTGVEGKVHSTSAFVEFASLTSKQEAIQCNITGIHHYFEVSAVPDLGEIIWENAHVSLAFIEYRKLLASVMNIFGLIGWSYLVYHIRTANIASQIESSPLGDLLGVDLSSHSDLLDSILNIYLPALIVEGLVRLIPKVLLVVCKWIRIKSLSEIEEWVLRWYFCYRLFTFIFVLISGSIIDAGDAVLRDPVAFLRKMSTNVVANVVFFISYVIISGGLQVSSRFSQFHNLIPEWFAKNIQRREAMSQRKLQKLKQTVKAFHTEEFVPLFIFVLMVDILYSALVPLAGAFVAGFFLCSYKIFRFLTIFVWGSDFQGGGFLFYTINELLFLVIYLMIAMLTGFLSLHGGKAAAMVFSSLLFVTYAIKQKIRRTFVDQSKTLSLAKARASDEIRDKRSIKQRKVEEYVRARQALKDISKDPVAGRNMNNVLLERLAPSNTDLVVESDDEEEECVRSSTSTDAPTMQQRFRHTTSYADLSDDEGYDKDHSHFVYRQPFLNKCSWELTPKPYRDSNTRNSQSNTIERGPDLV